MDSRGDGFVQRRMFETPIPLECTQDAKLTLDRHFRNPADMPQKQFRRRLPASSSRWHLDCVVHDTSLDIFFAIMNSNFFFWSFDYITML